MVKWGRAWRGAGAWLGWTILWGIAGIALYAVGVWVIGTSIVDSAQYIQNGDYTSVLGSAIVSAVLMLAGGLIVTLGSIAAFFKVNSEIVSEEVGRQHEAPAQTKCPTCGGSLRFIEQYQKWYCDKEQKYL